MMIVASNNITLSNVNDGTTVHIAYADSADGKDGFYVGGGTNLLQGTGTATGDVANGNGNLIEGSFNGYDAIKTNTAWSEKYINLKSALGRTNAKAGDWFTISVYVKADNQINTGSLYVSRALGDSTASTNDGSLDPILMSNKPITTQWKQYAWSFQINDISLQRTVTRVEYNLATGDNWIYWAGWMLEEGTIAHPWSPAPSESYPIYMGTYTDYTQADSLDPTAYKWTLIKGDKGDTGVSIKTFSTEYYLSTSEVEVTGGEWQNSFPTKTENTFIWYRNTITYTDNSTEVSAALPDAEANRLYSIGITNSTNISQIDDRITNEVTSITTVTTQLSDKQAATDENVSNLQKNTSDSLTNLNNAQASTAKDLADYKNTITQTYATKSDITQLSESVTTTISQAVEDAQKKTITTLAETVVDARGFTVSTDGADTHTTLNGTGLMVKDSSEKNVVKFTVSGEEVKSVKVEEDMSLGAHNTQVYADYEFDETTMADATTKINGTADYWIDDVQ